MAFLHGDIRTANIILSSSDFIKHIMHDGPVHTFAAGGLFTLLGRVPEYCDWQSFVVLNAFMQALAAILLFVLIMEVTGAIWWSFAGALMFGLYPSVIVASGRYLTEPYVVLCLMLFTYLATRTSALSKVSAGVIAGLVVLLKAVLAPSALLAAGIAGWYSHKGRRVQKKRSITQVASIFAGVSIALIPWFVFTQSVTGTGLLYTPRMADYNACVSLDVGTDGWSTYPQSDFVTSMMESKNPLAERLHVIGEHIPELTAITVRKFGRLVAHPWNDPRQPVFGVVSAVTQDLLHKIVLALCILGVSICLFDNRCNSYKRLRSQNRRLVLTCSLIFVAGHFLYLLTQAMGRNNYTMLPFVILLAVLGLRAAVSFLIRNTKMRPVQPRKFAIGAAISLFLAGFTWLICATENMGLPWLGFERSTQIQPGKSLEFDFDISSIKRRQSDNTVFIFVDADQSVESADLVINGKQLGKGFVPIGRFCADWYAQNRFLRTHARVLRIPQSSLRQWRAIPVPLHMVKLDGTNRLALSNNANRPLRVYGSCINRAFLPSPRALASDYMVNTMDSLDMRVPQRIADGSSKTPYGVTFVVASANGSIPERVSGEEKHFVFGMKNTSPVLLDASSFPESALTSSGELAVNSRTAAKNGSLVARVAVPDLRGGTHINIIVRGKAKLLSGDRRIGIKVSLNRASGRPITPFGFPDYVTVGSSASNEWTSFELSDSIPLSFVDGRVNALTVELTPVPVSQAEYRTSTTDVLIKQLEVSAALDNAILVR